MDTEVTYIWGYFELLGRKIHSISYCHLCFKINENSENRWQLIKYEENQQSSIIHEAMVASIHFK